MPRPSAAHSEDLRQIEHLVPIGFAFLLRYLTWFQALGMALGAVLYSFISSRIFAATQRPEEAGQTVSPGKLAYALSVFFLILLYPGQNYIVVAAWSNLSVGDSVSNLAGRRFGRSALPWNAQKTWVGMITSFGFSSIITFVLILWVGLPSSIHGNPSITALCYALAVSLVCSVAETLPLPVDDNITICLAGAVFLSFLSRAVVPGLPRIDSFLAGIALSAACVIPAFLLDAVSAGGAISGVIIATMTFLAFGLRGLIPLATFLIIGALFSSFCSRQKPDAIVAPGETGKCDAGQVWGTGSAIFLCALASIFLPDKAGVQTAFFASLAAAVGDTGTLQRRLRLGKGAPLVTSFMKANRGGSGAVPFEGDLLGLLAALAVGASGFYFRIISAWGWLWVALSAGVPLFWGDWVLSNASRNPVSRPMAKVFRTVVAACIALLLTKIRS